jgi:hypothetical protein
MNAFNCNNRNIQNSMLMSPAMITLAKLAQQYGPKIATKLRQKWRRRGPGTQTERKRRKNLPRSMAGMEINHADGGWKSATDRDRTIGITVDWFYDLIAARTSTSAPFNYAYTSAAKVASSQMNMHTALESKQEFQAWKNIARELKITACGVTIDYNRIPQSGEQFPELMLSLETDKKEVDPQTAPLNKSTMKLDMTKNGKKVYNVRLNKINSMEDNIDWQSTTTFNTPKMAMTIITNKNPVLDIGERLTVNLGTAHLWVRVLFRIPDAYSSGAKYVYMPQTVEQFKQLQEQDMLRRIEIALNDPIQKKLNRIKELNEIQQLMKDNNIDRDEAIKRVRRWDLLTISDNEEQDKNNEHESQSSGVITRLD